MQLFARRRGCWLPVRSSQGKWSCPDYVDHAVFSFHMKVCFISTINADVTATPRPATTVYSSTAWPVLDGSDAPCRNGQTAARTADWWRSVLHHRLRRGDGETGQSFNTKSAERRNAELACQATRRNETVAMFHAKTTIQCFVGSHWHSLISSISLLYHSRYWICNILFSYCCSNTMNESVWCPSTVLPSCPWVGLTHGFGWVGPGHTKWTHGQLCRIMLISLCYNRSISFSHCDRYVAWYWTGGS